MLYGTKPNSMRRMKQTNKMRQPNRCMGLAGAIIAMLLLLVSCGDEKKNISETTGSTATDAATTITDNTIYGKCGVNSAVHTLEIIADSGDTIVCSINPSDTTDTPDVVRGGLFAGDRIAVVTEKLDDGYTKAAKVINITSLLGRWVSLDRDFVIHEGGIVTSNDAQPQPYTDWKIFNGLLLLNSDTFDIYTLGADSLWLESDSGIYEYRRMR